MHHPAHLRVSGTALEREAHDFLLVSTSLLKIIIRLCMNKSSGYERGDE